jgi:hypothetical protein
MLDELHRRRLGDEPHQHENRQRQLDQRNGQRGGADHVLIVKEPEHGGAD